MKKARRLYKLAKVQMCHALRWLCAWLHGSFALCVGELGRHISYNGEALAMLGN